MKDLKKYLEELTSLPQLNVIYSLSDPNSDKIKYIGKTENLYKRIKNHYKPSKLKSKTHKNNWINYLLKENKRVIVSVVEECENYEYLNKAEIKWIKYYKSIGCDLTNGTEGGDGGRMSDEAIAKMVAKKTGVKLTEEHKRKISEGNKGKIVSDETRNKIGKAHKGKNVSNEAKKKMSDSHKGQIAWNKGKKTPNETKKKISEANKGKKTSEETKKKISKSLLGNKHCLGRKDSEFTKNKKSEIHKKKVKHIILNKVYPSVKDCIFNLKISKRAFYKMVKEKSIIYI